MISAFGVDHGYQDVEKLANPIQALRTLGGGAAKVAGAGAHRAPGMSAMPKPAGALRTLTGQAGVGVSGGLKRLGAKVTGTPGKRAAPTMRTRLGGAITGLGQRTTSNPVRTGAVALGGGAAAVGGGGLAIGNRRRQPGT
jgi:hypothetical protein